MTNETQKVKVMRRTGCPSGCYYSEEIDFAEMSAYALACFKQECREGKNNLTCALPEDTNDARENIRGLEAGVESMDAALNNAREELPLISSNTKVYASRLISIDEEVRRDKTTTYDPNKFFSADDTTRLKYHLTNLGLENTPILNSGHLRFKGKDVYLIESAKREEELKEKWGLILGFPLGVGAGLTTVVGGLLLGCFARLPPGLTAASSLGIGCIAGGYVGYYANKLGKKFGTKLGGKVPLLEYTRNPFRNLAYEMEARTKFISETIGGRGH